MDKYRMQVFYDGLAELGITLSDEQVNQFIKYYELLIEWNSFMNLTAITEFDEVVTKHFLDSLSLCKAVDCTEKRKVIDIGTGAGFPGIPLKIAFPNLEITLLDSLGKRVKFLNEVIMQLGLTDIEAVHSRAEDYVKEAGKREGYDLCVSRAVANLSTLSEYCLPYVKVGGYFVPYKSEKTKEEIHAAQKAVSILGGKIEGQVEFCLADTDIYRNLIFICKREKTPGKYPRKSGLPAKEPIT